jgi:hypothetical protein
MDSHLPRHSARRTPARAIKIIFELGPRIRTRNHLLRANSVDPKNSNLKCMVPGRELHALERILGNGTLSKVEERRVARKSK